MTEEDSTTRAVEMVEKEILKGAHALGISTMLNSSNRTSSVRASNAAIIMTTVRLIKIKMAAPRLFLETTLTATKPHLLQAYY
ncbi:hypothetical protein FRC12_018427 [Ceratobasidium sp. 428]|nr:hypothetical protein FRC12_018427 [Ceratobasidium sp. 428]